jgi:hypothetical protein
VVVKQTITPEGIANTPGEFEVTATPQEENTVEFKITRFVHESRHRIGNITIRKDGHTVVECSLQSWPHPSHSKKPESVCYLFTIAKDCISGSEFVLHESPLGELEGDKEHTPIPMPGGEIYHFRLRDFPANDQAADAVKESKEERLQKAKAEWEKRFAERLKTQMMLQRSRAFPSPSQNLPKGSQQREFNGMTYYIVPLDADQQP